MEDYIAVRPSSIMSANDIYRLRRWPRLWGLTRDREVRQMQIQVDDET